MTSTDRPGGNRTAGPYALTTGWFYEFLQTSRRHLPDTTLHLTIAPGLFDKFLILDPNDEDVLENPAHTITFRRRDLDRCRNTEQFLLHPSSCQHVCLQRRRRYLCKVQSFRPTKRSQLHYTAFLKRCLDHDGQHPSTFDTYRVIAR